MSGWIYQEQPAPHALTVSPVEPNRHRGTEKYFGKEDVNILENCHKCYSLSAGDADEKRYLWWQMG